MYPSDLLLIILFGLGFSCQEKQPPKQLQIRPNIVLIVADDLGYSDLGCFGSEIATPNIDALARQGQILTNFYTASACSPTRAMLLSGTDNHIAGLGNFAERVNNIKQQAGQPGYEGHLNNKVVSVAQLIKDQGYHTYIAGKWHLGLTPDQSPKAKGFERSFTLLDGSAHHSRPDNNSRLFWEDDDYTRYPQGEYSTDIYTDKLIGFLDEDRSDNQPFFLFAAYTSPHWPLQAPSKYIEKYQGVYDAGYDSLRARRFKGLKKKGILTNNTQLSKLPSIKGNLFDISDRLLLPWASLNTAQQAIEARKMEIYAGMVDNLDYNIGRLIKYLKETGKYKNTLFVFFSDNGAAVLEYNYTPSELDPLTSMGTPNSFVAYGPQWAHASSAAYRLYKGYTTEGGIHSPLIIKMPFQDQSEGLIPAFATVMDMAPTFLEVAGGHYPSTYQGNSLAPYKGKSLLPLLLQEEHLVHPKDYVMGWELFGRCALRKGKWKISQVQFPLGTGEFELFNLEEDPTESYDLSEEYPNKYQELLVEWKRYVEENGVILLDE